MKELDRLKIPFASNMDMTPVTAGSSIPLPTVEAKWPSAVAPVYPSTNGPAAAVSLML